MCCSNNQLPTDILRPSRMRKRTTSLNITSSLLDPSFTIDEADNFKDTLEPLKFRCGESVEKKLTRSLSEAHKDVQSITSDLITVGVELQVARQTIESLYSDLCETRKELVRSQTLLSESRKKAKKPLERKPSTIEKVFVFYRCFSSHEP